MNSLLISKRKTQNIECHKSFNFELNCLPCNNDILKAYLIFLSKLRELCSLHNVSKNVSGRRRCCHPNGCSSAPTCSASWSALRRSATFSSSSRPGLCVLFSVCWLLHQEKKGAELEWKGVEAGGGSEVCGTACPRDLHRRWLWRWRQRQRRAAAPFSQFSQFFTFFAHDWQQQAVGRAVGSCGEQAQAQ